MRPPDARRVTRPSWAPEWRTPHTLLAGFFAIVALVFAVRAGPPATSIDPQEAFRLGEAAVSNASTLEVTLFLEEGSLVRTVKTTVAASNDPSEVAQAVVERLRLELQEQGTWPPAWPTPKVTRFDLDRNSVAVLDIATPDGPHDGPGIDAERRIVASFTATLSELGTERIAFLRDGRATGTWFDHVAVPSTLD